MTDAVHLPKRRRAKRRQHAFGGCKTCRKRHVKCDQVRPSCLVCRAVGEICEGYASEVRWMPMATPSSARTGQLDSYDRYDATSNSTRHYLYSEEDRESMSRTLQENLSSSSVDRSLADIDVRSKDPRDIEAANLTIGPFGVLHFGLSSRPPSFSHAPVPLEPVAQQPCLPDPDLPSGRVIDESIPSENTFSLDQIDLNSVSIPSMTDYFDPILGFDSNLHWGDLFALDFDNGNSLLQPCPASEVDYFASENQVIQADQSDQRPLSTRSSLDNALSRRTPEDHERLPYGIADSKNIAEVKTEAEAQFLLKHFQDQVIPQISFMPAKPKSPWTLLHLPGTVQTLAKLTYLGGEVKHANAATLYSSLASASYHLAVNSPSELREERTYWSNLSDRLKDRAKTHLQISLREELKGTEKAKYKDQLMAILSLLSISTISAHQEDTRCYLIDAERLLRVRGLAKRDMSRKCRLLHHVYTWIRIVGESSYVIHDYQKFGLMVDNMSKAYIASRAGTDDGQGRDMDASAHNDRLDDFLRIDTHSSDSDHESNEDQEERGGDFDIHLNDSRQRSGGLYHLYGISETWLSLVSQTTRLANILDAAKYGKEVDLGFLEFLQKRAARLEDLVCSFALDHSDVEEADNATCAEHHMMCALNSALVILFYRRIRKVNPLILQGHVESVIKSLRDFDASTASLEGVHPGSPWPAFITGCEAKNRADRFFLLSWLDIRYQYTKLECFTQSKNCMQEVWERQDEPTQMLTSGSGGSVNVRPRESATTNGTWVEYSREKNCWVMLF